MTISDCASTVYCCRVQDSVQLIASIPPIITLMVMKVVTVLSFTRTDSSHLSRPFKPALLHYSTLLAAQVLSGSNRLNMNYNICAHAGGENEYLAVLMQQRHIESPNHSWKVVFTVCMRTPCCVEVS